MALTVNTDTGLFVNTPTAADRTTAAMARRALGSLFWSDSANPGIARPGILHSDQYQPFAFGNYSSSALQFTVGPGYALANRSSSPSLGTYLVGNPGTVTLTLAPADPTNPRYDVIYIQAADPEAGDTGHALVGVQTGTPSSSPAFPGSSPYPFTLNVQGGVPVGQVYVPAGATAATSLSFFQYALKHAGGVSQGYGAAMTGLQNRMMVQQVYSSTSNLLPANPIRGDRILFNQWNDSAGSGLILGASMPWIIGKYDGTKWVPWESAQPWDVTVFPYTSIIASNTFGANLTGGRIRIVEGMMELDLTFSWVNTPSISNGAYFSVTNNPFDVNSYRAPYDAGGVVLVVGGNVYTGSLYWGPNRVYPSVLSATGNYATSGAAATGNIQNVSTPYGPATIGNGDKMYIRTRLPLLGVA